MRISDWSPYVCSSDPLTLRPAWLSDVLLLENCQPLANTSVALRDRRGSVMAESAAGAAIGEWMPGTFVIGARLSGKAQVFEAEVRHGVERILALAPLYEQPVYIVHGRVAGHLLGDPDLHLMAGLPLPSPRRVITLGVACFVVS